MNKLRDTELIITNSGRIYHLNLKKEEIADDIILVGDPNRVEQISNKFEKITAGEHILNRNRRNFKQYKK